MKRRKEVRFHRAKNGFGGYNGKFPTLQKTRKQNTLVAEKTRKKWGTERGRS